MPGDVATVCRVPESEFAERHLAPRRSLHIDKPNRNNRMRRIVLATIAAAGLALPALAQQTPPQAQSSGHQSQTTPNAGATQKLSIHQMNESQVRQIQQALDGKKFNAGHADGKWGPETDRAMKAFQKSQNMQQADEIDSKMLMALGLQPDAFGLAGGNSETTGQAPPE
jgi:peptidoglycan hydrolase-like protein with peptidoglycan-binding domain